MDLSKPNSDGYLIPPPREFASDKKNWVVTGICMNPISDEELLISYSNGISMVWHIQQHRVVYISQLPSSISSVCWSPKGKEFMASDTNGTLHVWQYSCEDEPSMASKPKKSFIGRRQ